MKNENNCNIYYIHFDSGFSAEPLTVPEFQLNLFHSLIFLFQSPQGLTKAAVITAVKAGYRFIDCANDYDNEHTIGEALKELYAKGVVKRFTYYLRLTIYHLAYQIHQPIPKLQIHFFKS